MTPELLTLVLVLFIGALWLIGGAMFIRQLRRIRRGTRERSDDLPYREERR